MAGVVKRRPTLHECLVSGKNPLPATIKQVIDNPCRVWQYRGRGDAMVATPTNKG